MTPDAQDRDVFALAYDAVRRRLEAELLAERSATAVIACPGWCVRDVIAHLAGLCEDWVAGRFEDYASDSWTARQVDRFAGRPMEDIFGAWSQAAAAFAHLPDDTFLGTPSRWAFGDAVVHEADVREAARLGRVPDDAVQLSLRGAFARWREVLRAANAPSLLIRCADGREWPFRPADGPADPAVVVETDSYELFRALAGRRSVAQVRQWKWTRDPHPFLDIGPAYPFSWASEQIVD